jgi:hypothetical protein
VNRSAAPLMQLKELDPWGRISLPVSQLLQNPIIFLLLQGSKINILQTFFKKS